MEIVVSTKATLNSSFLCDYYDQTLYWRIIVTAFTIQFVQQFELSLLLTLPQDYLSVYLCVGPWTLHSISVVVHGLSGVCQKRVADIDGTPLTMGMATSTSRGRPSMNLVVPSISCGWQSMTPSWWFVGWFRPRSSVLICWGSTGYDLFNNSSCLNKTAHWYTLYSYITTFRCEIRGCSFPDKRKTENWSKVINYNNQSIILQVL